MERIVAISLKLRMALCDWHSLSSKMDAETLATKMRNAEILRTGMEVLEEPHAIDCKA